MEWNAAIMEVITGTKFHNIKYNLHCHCFYVVVLFYKTYSIAFINFLDIVCCEGQKKAYGFII